MLQSIVKRKKNYWLHFLDFAVAMLFMILVQSRRHVGGFGGFSPPKQSSKPPKLK